MIYAHRGISQSDLSQRAWAQNAHQELVPYTANHSLGLVVDMPFVGVGGKSTNAQGWLRSSQYYYGELSKQHPEYFSSANTDRISEGLVPRVDEQFVRYFPEFDGFQGDKLIHHHIGEDGQVVAIPQSLHNGYGGIHNIEKELGITDNAEAHSAECQRLLENGVENPTLEQAVGQDPQPEQQVTPEQNTQVTDASENQVASNKGIESFREQSAKEKMSMAERFNAAKEEAVRRNGEKNGKTQQRQEVREELSP